VRWSKILFNISNYDDFYVAKLASCAPNLETACKSPFNTNIERFSPPYLQIAETSGRPEIISFPSSVTHSSSYKINVKDPLSIKRATFIRYTSTTHSTNTDQRFFELEILSRDEKSVYVRFPPSNVGVPGPYHLFFLDEKGVPSVAGMVMMASGNKVDVKLPETPNSAEQKNSGMKSIFVLLMVIGLVSWMNFD
jgi:hypothetical protein